MWSRIKTAELKNHFQVINFMDISGLTENRECVLSDSKLSLVMTKCLLNNVHEETILS